MEVEISSLSFTGKDCAGALVKGQDRLGWIRRPGPCVAEPQSRQQMKVCRCWAAIGCRYPDADIFRVSLGIFHKNVKVTIFIEYAGINKLELRLAAGAAVVL